MLTTTFNKGDKVKDITNYKIYVSGSGGSYFRELVLTVMPSKGSVLYQLSTSQYGGTVFTPNENNVYTPDEIRYVAAISKITTETGISTSHGTDDLDGNYLRFRIIRGTDTESKNPEWLELTSSNKGTGYTVDSKIAVTVKGDSDITGIEWAIIKKADLTNLDNDDYWDRETVVISRSGKKGDTGEGISNVIEYYLVSDKGTGITNKSGNWQKNTIPSFTSTNIYLWNYEEIVYTNKTETTDAA